MAPKGNTVFDPVTANEVIIRTNKYKQKVMDNASEIAKICKDLQEEKLEGGNGDIIRESLGTITQSCAQLTTTIQVIIKSLNTKLGLYVEANQAGKVAGAADNMQKASSKVGKKE